MQETQTEQTEELSVGGQIDSVEDIFSASEYYENIPKYMQKFLSVSLLSTQINSVSTNKETLNIELLFEPMKPFKKTFDIIVTQILEKDSRQSFGGRYLLPITVEAMPPDFDDHICIQSNYMVTSNVSFKMTNTKKKAAQFRSYLTHDSAHEFSIDPPSGILPSYGATGTPIYIAFTPVEYEGKDKMGKLIIETDLMFWSYELKGRLPKYVPPRVQKTASHLKN